MACIDKSQKVLQRHRTMDIAVVRSARLRLKRPVEHEYSTEAQPATVV